PKTTLRVFDINLRSPFIDFQVIDQSLLLANVLKLNDEELRILAQRYDLTGSEATLLSAVSARFQLHTIALTRGVNGSMLWSHETVSESSGTSVKVVDTVGAGDAFTAALVLGLLSKETLHMINNQTSQVAAYACSQPGATMAFPTDLRVSASR
ncbi:MAG: PfkB family carbohydrate kinase, partial [Lacipirellulaceae bacterium]